MAHKSALGIAILYLRYEHGVGRNEVLRDTGGGKMKKGLASRPTGGQDQTVGEKTPL